MSFETIRASLGAIEAENEHLRARVEEYAKVIQWMIKNPFDAQGILLGNVHSGCPTVGDLLDRICELADHEAAEEA